MHWGNIRKRDEAGKRGMARERESRLCVFVCEKEKETDNAQKCRKIPPN